MPKIMIAADDHTDADAASMTLSERISALPSAAQQADAMESQCW
jgi:hypothetical protein